MAKKGISPVVGYVLLITFGIIMSVIVYTYLRTYVPNDPVDCPDSTSFFIKDEICQSGQLNITIVNNGKFNIGGYYIFASSDSNVEIATEEIVSKFQDSGDSKYVEVVNYILFNESNQTVGLKPKQELKHTYNLGTFDPVLIELIPLRFEEEDGVQKFASCGRSKIRQEVSC